jgi:hypothetical protein
MQVLCQVVCVFFYFEYCVIPQMPFVNNITKAAGKYDSHYDKFREYRQRALNYPKNNKKTHYIVRLSS